MLNIGIENITYVPFDLYSQEELDLEKSNVFMIDAGHKYHEVISDIDRCMRMSADGDSYIIFDDYGLITHEENVKRAVDDSINQNKIEVIKKIGYQKGHEFSHKFLKDSEGLICRIVK